MRSLLITMILFFMTALQAEDGIGKLYHFSEDVRNVVHESSPIPEDFVLDEEQTDKAVAYMELDQELGDYAFSETLITPKDTDQPCDKTSSSDSSKKALAKKIEERKYNIYFTMTFNDAKAVGLAEGFMGKDNYSTFILQQSQAGNFKANQIQNLNQLKNKFKSENPDITLSALSFKEREEKLRDFAKSHTGVEIPKGMLLSELVISHAISNPNDWKTGMSQAKDDLSFEQKILVASHLGGKFSDRYNYDRAGGKGTGVVTIEEMLESVRSGKPGGICRDVSMAQSAILKELGVPKDKIYQLGYNTIGGGHAVVAIQDPNNPKNIVKLNYGYVSESDGAVGSSALIQNTSLPDFGMRNRVYDADGVPVASLPTEIGEVLYDVTEGNKGKIVPPSRHNLMKVNVDTPFGKGKVFTGETSSGDKVVGVALQKNFSTKRTDNEVAVAAISREGDRSFATLSQEALYLRAKTTFKGPRYDSENFSISSRAGVETEALLMKNKLNYSFGSQEESNVDVNIKPFIGASSTWSSDDKKTKLTADAEIEGYVVNDNIQTTLNEGTTLAFNKATFRTGIERKVTPQMKVVGETGVVLRQIGNSASFSGGIIKESSSSNYRALATYSTPLTNDVPIFLPESQKSFGLSVGGDHKRSGIYYQLEYNRNLDNKSNTVGLSAGWKF